MEKESRWHDEPLFGRARKKRGRYLVIYATPGSRCPVFVAGIKYPSIFDAAHEADISLRWLNVSIKKNSGAPIVIKGQFVVTDSWVQAHIRKTKIWRGLA